MPTLATIAARKIRAALAAAWGWVRTWLSPVPGAIKDRINSKELVRVLITAMLAGGGLGPVLLALAGNLGLIMPGLDPSVSATLMAVLAALAETFRRLQQEDHDTHE